MRLHAPVLSPGRRGPARLHCDHELAWDPGGPLRAPEPGDAPITLGEPVLLIPGLVDVHVHLPQVRVRGQFQDALLPWLREHIWPEEARCADSTYLSALGAEFRDGLLRAGTTAALVWGSPHEESAATVLDGLDPLRVAGGDVLMDREGPQALLRPAERCLDGAERGLRRWGRRYILTPRFAPSCTEPLLRGCGSLTRRGARLQTHLSENRDEIAWVRSLFPEDPSYTAVYERAGLLGPGTVVAHAIHLGDDELRTLAAHGCAVAHCPTSNVALSSGRMPLERLQAAGLRVALATDVGAGPSLSMLDVLDAALSVHGGFLDLSPGAALALATREGAAVLELPTGILRPGRPADIVALRLPGGLRRGEGGDRALLRILDDFRGRWEDAVAAVWIDGRPVVGPGVQASL
jgi:guanine deaminase